MNKLLTKYLVLTKLFFFLNFLNYLMKNCRNEKFGCNRFK